MIDEILQSMQVARGELKQRYDDLEPVQRRVVHGLIIVFSLFLMFLPIRCARSGLAEREKRLNELVGHAHEFVKLRDDFLAVSAQLAKAKGGESASADPLKSMVYQVADSLNLDREKIDLKTQPSVNHPQYTELAKDVTLSQVAVADGMRFLERLKKQGDVPLVVKKVDIKTLVKDRNMLDKMTLTLTTWQGN